MDKSKILSLGDLVAVAKELHLVHGGRVGLWPMFRLVMWADQRMGLSPDHRENEINHLIRQARQEVELDGEPTGEAVSLIALAESLADLLPVVEEAVLKARQA